MNPFDEAATRLEATTKWLRDMAANVTLPVEPGLNLQAAITHLRSALGDAYFTIDMELKFPFQSEAVVEWQVWDGRQRHTGSSLAEAVNATLRAQKPPDTVATVGEAAAALAPLDPGAKAPF